MLSGGGNLGALRVGMLHALVESGVHPEMIVETSVGALNGAFLARHPGTSGIAEIIAFWSSLRRRDLYVLPTAPLEVERLRARIDTSSATMNLDGLAVRIVPPPRVHVPLGDLRQSPRLIELGYMHAKNWLTAGSPSEAVSTMRAGRSLT